MRCCAVLSTLFARLHGLAQFSLGKLLLSCSRNPALEGQTMRWDKVCKRKLHIDCFHLLNMNSGDNAALHVETRATRNNQYSSHQVAR